MFEDRIQPPRADILSRLVNFIGVGREFFDCVIGEIQIDTFCFEQRHVLFRQRILWLLQDPDKVLFREVVQLDANRKSTLQLRHQFAGLMLVKRSGRDKQNMVCLNVSVLCLDRCAFNDRQQVPLNALSRNVCSFAFARDDLVDFVEEDDPKVLS